MHKLLCGIDEAGRGPLAGSLVMAGVVLKSPIPGLMDSKKLTEKKREALYPLIIENSEYHIVSFSAREVDELGISKCLHDGLLEIQKYLKDCEYLFDGNSTFGVENITTMVKADDKVAEVSAASILAKVTRDRHMVKMAEVYPQYGFEKHKGYGTKAHMEALAKYDRCEVHRKTFRVKCLDEPPLI
ncbi:MAG: Ribonuclease HII (EC [uncultured Sulfurovum sp.]|uniref:Ribonuclease HII n=1 Tax=uncultured Sulfurovum sp. TaxID=269237 RepID=A0A6S6TE35_9BACT|nr:MAG: Ribonuclease HII (EC [uncultured Sulfurovum sp.]